MKKKQATPSRRGFLKKAGCGLGAVALSTSSFAFSTLVACANKTERKLGVALVGLGSYSTHQLAPALQETKHCRLAGIVTGTPAKAEKWSRQYDITKAHIYNYDNFDRIADDPDIDIIYVVLPNAMHAEFTIRAAKAGKHVICEKPMAISVKECEEMIAACKKAGRLLQIGYRLQYEPHNRELMRLGQKKVLGEVKTIETSNAFYGVGMKNWRLEKALSGGGPLMDMGIYCIQGSRYTLGKEPVSVTAQQFKTRPEVFKEVEETLFWQMEFPGGAAATCMTSYAARSSRLTVYAEKGNFELDPAFNYGPLAGHVKGTPMGFPTTNQQAVQMDAFAENILKHTPCLVPGEEGLRDLKVIEAIYKAMENGEKVGI